MPSFRRFWPRLVLALAAVVCGGGTLATGRAAEVELGDVLKSGANRHVTKGLLLAETDVGQIDFTQLVASAQKDVQVAFVLDATDSMGRDLKSAVGALATFAAGIADRQDPAQAQGRVEFALVLFRDWGAPSGSVTVPVDEFTDDLKLVAARLDAVETETGAPGVQERVAEEIDRALDLNWRQDENVSRWIIVCGDAPPHTFNAQGDPQRTRQISDEQLVERATAQGIVCSGIVCATGFLRPPAESPDRPSDAKAEEKAAATRKLSHQRTLEFLEKLSTATGGQVIDLADPKVAELLAARVQATEHWETVTSVSPINETEIVTARANGPRAFGSPAVGGGAGGSAVAVAILPHLPLDNMEYDATQPEVQIATALRDKLAHVPNFRLKSTRDVQAALASIATKNTAPEGSDAMRLQALGQSLKVDYLVWGRRKNAGAEVTIESGVYRAADGALLASATAAANGDQAGLRLPGELCARLLEQAHEALTKDSQAPRKDVQAFGQVAKTPVLKGELSAPLSRNSRAHRCLLAGLDLLEQGLAFTQEDPHVQPILEQARQQLEAGLGFEDDNPFMHLLLASCHYAQAQRGQADDSVARCYKALEQAKRCQDLATSAEIKTEIAADYALLVTRDYPAAIQLYGELAEQTGNPLGNFALRAHWTLAFLYLGDWGVKQHAPQLVNLPEARKHIVAVLAHWADSPEADHFRKRLDLVGSGSDEIDVPLLNHRALAGQP